MKFLPIIALVLVAMAISSSAERSKDRRRVNNRFEQPLRKSQKEKPSRLKFHKQQQQQSAAPIVIFRPSSSAMQTGPVYTNSQTNSGSNYGSYSGSYGGQSSYDADQDQAIAEEVEEALQEIEDEADADEGAEVRNKRQKPVLKLKKIKGKNKGYKLIVPAKYMSEYENDQPRRPASALKKRRLQQVRSSSNKW